MKIIKRIAGIILTLIVLLVIIVAVKFSTDRNNPYNNAIADNLIPTFKEIPIDFTHQFNGTESLPVTASVLIDIDNDGVDELFLGGGYNQQDEIFSYKEGKFNKIATCINL